MTLFLANGATPIAASDARLTIHLLSGEIIPPADAQAIQRICALLSYNKSRILCVLRYYVDVYDFLYTILIFHINGLIDEFRRQ
jgi:hypothetical protein